MRLAGLFALLALLALPLAAQTRERSDCDMVEVFGYPPIEVCGSNRETLTSFRDRIAMAERLSGRALTEAYREIACDAQPLERNLRLVVDDNLTRAAREALSNEEQFVDIAESGMPELFRGASFDEHFRLSATSWERLRRVLADRRLDPNLRVALLAVLQSAGMSEPLIDRLARDRSDPIQFWAAKFVVSKFDDSSLTELIDDPSNPLHAAAAVSAAEERRTPEVLHALCRIALDHRASGDARNLAATFVAQEAGTNAGCLACVRELLDSRNLFTTFLSSNSAELIFQMLPVEVANALAPDFDLTQIVDPVQRASLDDLLFQLRAAPYMPIDDH
jgi:hypothetical protein